jgi:chemotaxis protein MotB
MSKRKEEPEKENNERWTLTYLDMITLLFCLFVVLYAMSNVDPAKFEQLAESLSEAFDGGNWGILEERSGSAGILSGVQKPMIVAKPQPKEAKERLLEELKKIMKGNNFMATEIADGIKITLFSDLYFGSGETKISEDGYAALRALAPALLQVDNDIRVEGHTDAAPVNPGSEFASNWDLSSQRAIAVLEALSEYGVSETRMSAVAHGSVKPLYPNDTPEGRSYNRRVEIIILFTKAE